MNIQQLTAVMHHFVATQGWYEPSSPRPQTACNLAISLNLEAAEVLALFQWGDQAVDPHELGSELADVALYLLQLASITGIDLEQAILSKLKRNYQRVW